MAEPRGQLVEPPFRFERFEGRRRLRHVPLDELGIRFEPHQPEEACEARERDVVVVSHVSPIKAAVAWALGVGDEITWRMWVAPASITRIGWSGPAPSLRSFNELAHLD